MNYESLEDFLKTVQNVEKINGCLYKFWYSGIECAGIVTRSTVNGELVNEWIEIKPMMAQYDIGKGAGQSELFHLNK